MGQSPSELEQGEWDEVSKEDDVVTSSEQYHGTLGIVQVNKVW